MDYDGSQDINCENTAINKIQQLATQLSMTHFLEHIVDELKLLNLHIYNVSCVSIIYSEIIPVAKG